MPSVFTDEVLAETVSQIEGYENAYRSVETGARVYVGMDACEATVAYFDQWTAYTYFCLAKELAVFKQDATYLVAIPDMRCYWGPTGTRNGDVTFLALTPGSRALRVNAQRRYSELEQGDPLRFGRTVSRGISARGKRRANKDGHILSADLGKVADRRGRRKARREG